MKVSDNNKSSRMKTFWAVVLLAALFGGGILLGMTWHIGHGANTRQIAMSDKQCDRIADRIVSETNADKLRSLNEIFAANCAGRIIENPVQTTADFVEDNKVLTTCEKIEKLLLADLYDPNSRDPFHHTENAAVYNKLSQHGCAEHSENFKQLMNQEYAIANALGAAQKNINENMRTCEEIEVRLRQDLREYAANSKDYLYNAEVYGTLVQRGCAENSQKYKDLALRQIEIAAALSRDNEMTQPENAEIVIDTYKKLQMQNQARDFLNKVQQLSDPAIDFILKMEKVLNE